MKLKCVNHFDVKPKGKKCEVNTLVGILFSFAASVLLISCDTKVQKKRGEAEPISPEADERIATTGSPSSPTSTDPVLSDYNFSGIVSLANCSGSLIRYTNSSDKDNALVLTNAHCDSVMPRRNNSFIQNKESRQSFTLVSDSGQSDVGEIKAIKLLYATMTGTDIAIYQLAETYTYLRDRYKVEAFTIAEDSFSIGDSIEIISGYWRRGYSCSVEATIPVLEEDIFFFKESLRYSKPGCETIGGTSGSPVVLAGTKQVIAISNTLNENGELCTLNNPCEIGNDGVKRAYKGNSYGQQTAWIYSCLNTENQIDLMIEGCKLYH